MFIGVGDSCHISYSVDSYSYVSLSGLITSAGEETYFFCYCLLSEVFPLPLGPLDRLFSFIVALPEPSI